jgi:hypothetical protein
MKKVTRKYLHSCLIFLVRANVCQNGASYITQLSKHHRARLKILSFTSTLAFLAGVSLSMMKKVTRKYFHSCIIFVGETDICQNGAPYITPLSKPKQARLKILSSTNTLAY